MIVRKTCTANVDDGVLLCSNPGVQWWNIGDIMVCNCADHAIWDWTNTFNTYEDALVYAAMHCL